MIHLFLFFYYIPIFLLTGYGRSTTIEDISDPQVSFFSSIYKEIDNPRLKSRIADIVWIKNKSNQDALDTAIKNYLKIPISDPHDGNVCLRRALQLCKANKKRYEAKIKFVSNCLFNKFQDEISKNISLPQIFLDFSLPVDASIVAEKLENFAEDFFSQEDYNKAKKYFCEATVWYEKSHNETKISDMIVRQAESIEKQAKKEISDDIYGSIKAIILYESIISKYRLLPQSYRKSNNIENKIKTLRSKRQYYGEMVSENCPISSVFQTDITEMSKLSTDRVRGKEKSKALLEFCKIYIGKKVSKIKEDAQNSLKNNFFSSAIPITFINKERFIAKKPSFDPNHPDEKNIWYAMINQYIQGIPIISAGLIIPALNVIKEEHFLIEDDFFYFVSNSSSIPIDSWNFFSKGLYLGYKNDFVGALHILVPHFENVIRQHLKWNEISTTYHDPKTGIETENGLSSLLSSKGAEDIFGADLIFEIKALFCDSFGFNLRNNLAHGIITYEACCSYQALYVWWFLFRFVFLSLWENQKRK